MAASNQAGAPELAGVVDALLARVALGDREAFATLYQVTCNLLMGICVRILSDRPEAEDVLQDVYISVWAKAAQFDAGRAGGMAWLGSMARHRAIDRLRGSPARSARVSTTILETVPDASPSPAAHAVASSESDRLRHCMGLLDPIRHSLIRTAFFEGATYEQLAARSGSPLGSVKSWIRRGLKQLRECLEQ